METFGIAGIVLFWPIAIVASVWFVRRGEKKLGRYAIVAALVFVPLLCTLSMARYIFITEPLTQAVLDGDQARVTTLLKWSADPNDYDGLCPLLEAVRSGNTEIVRLLLDHGARVDEDAWGETPLKMAEANHDREMVRLLRNAGAKR